MDDVLRPCVPEYRKEKTSEGEGTDSTLDVCMNSLTNPLMLTALYGGV